MATQKDNAERIVALLSDQKRRYERTDRSWWPDYVFHFTDVQNAAQILSDGKLYSRNRAIALKINYLDAASPSIITHSSGRVKNYVRLYFRPLTPTQYRMEGIRPEARRWKDAEGYPAHCPVPVFFMFDAQKTLTRNDCEFTDGNFASGKASKGRSADFFCNLPFEQIYHHGWFNPDDPANSSIVHNRQAEVLIPNELKLDQLKTIACRTVAEKETLLSLLPDHLREKFQLRIRVPNYELFYKYWSFVETVDLSEDKVTIHFSPDSLTPEAFRAVIEFTNLDTGAIHTKEINPFKANSRTTIDLPQRTFHYTIRLTLDGNVAYQNTYHPLPF